MAGLGARVKLTGVGCVTPRGDDCHPPGPPSSLDSAVGPPGPCPGMGKVDRPAATRHQLFSGLHPAGHTLL